VTDLWHRISTWPLMPQGVPMHAEALPDQQGTGKRGARWDRGWAGVPIRLPPSTNSSLGRGKNRRGALRCEFEVRVGRGTETAPHFCVPRTIKTGLVATRSTPSATLPSIRWRITNYFAERVSQAAHENRCPKVFNSRTINVTIWSSSELTLNYPEVLIRNYAGYHRSKRLYKSSL
jgi:hypothetical protein